MKNSMKPLELQVHVHSIKRASYTIMNVSRIFNHPINDFYSSRIEKPNTDSSCAFLCSCTSKGSAAMIASFISVQWSKKQFQMQQKSMQAASALNFFPRHRQNSSHFPLLLPCVTFVLICIIPPFFSWSSYHHTYSLSLQTGWMHCISCENI